MRRCWDISASKRPQFNELVTLIGQILDDNVKQVRTLLNYLHGKPYGDSFFKFYLELSGPYIRMNSLQHEYEQDISILKEPATRKETVCDVESAPVTNAVSNPTYMMLQGTSQLAKDYVNVPKSSKKESVSLDIDQQEGYLKMSPIVPKQKRSIRDSDESSVYL